MAYGWKKGRQEYRKLGLPLDEDGESRIWAALERQGEKENPALSPGHDPAMWFVKTLVMAWYNSHIKTPRYYYKDRNEINEQIKQAQRDAEKE